MNNNSCVFIAPMPDPVMRVVVGRLNKGRCRCNKTPDDLSDYTIVPPLSQVYQYNVYLCPSCKKAAFYGKVTNDDHITVNRVV